jgi:hypothetical protein
VTSVHDLTDEQAFWLTRLLRSRPRSGVIDQFTIPDSVHDVLLEKGLLQWKRGRMEITLDGIREIAHRPSTED